MVLIPHLNQGTMKQDKIESHADQHGNETFVVMFSYAIIDPYAVMIKFLYASK
jgi:hypothetical protein